MNDTQRILGELSEFKRATLEKLGTVDRKIDALDAFKWKATGIMATVVFIFEAIGQYIRSK